MLFDLYEAPNTIFPLNMTLDAKTNFLKEATK